VAWLPVCVSGGLTHGTAVLTKRDELAWFVQCDELMKVVVGLSARLCRCFFCPL
jgi:hypothetical protein